MINEADTVFVSPVNFFEIAIKIKIGKSIGLNRPIREVINASLQSGFTWKPIQAQHLEAYQTLPLIESHRDPFDRLLLATALADKLTIISFDQNFALYNPIVSTLW